MRITLLRHGKTQGNIDMAYIGQTDQPVCDIGLEEIKNMIDKYLDTDMVFCSPLKRCLQTAKLIYGNYTPIIKTDLQEGSFGDFEGKTYEDLKDNLDYRKSIESGGVIPFPNAEDLGEFKKRCQNECFNIVEEASLQNAKHITIVCHGGTIMSILSKISHTDREFYSWQPKNASGYIFDYNFELKKAENIEEL